jgi:1-acyl-sn-glycerol-3-phosphate acyltransferase
MNTETILQLKIRFVTWHGFFSTPFLGWYLRNMRCYPIINKQGLGVLDQLIEYLQEGSIVGIFPEGKMQKENMQEIKAGRGVAYLMQKTQAPVIPVSLEYKRRWKYIPLYTFDMHIGKNLQYDIIEDNQLQQISNNVLESIYQLGKTS